MKGGLGVSIITNEEEKSMRMEHGTPSVHKKELWERLGHQQSGLKRKDHRAESRGS